MRAGKVGFLDGEFTMGARKRLHAKLTKIAAPLNLPTGPRRGRADKDMETLIERKLKMFPDDQRQIVSAKVVMVGDKFRIEVASATLA